MSSQIAVRQKIDGSTNAARPPRDDSDDDGDDDEGPVKPQKRHFRSRAHSNVLNANDFWYPAKPTDVPTHEYFPGNATDGAPLASRHITFVDIGCGYGSLLLELAKSFPEDLMLGVEIRPKIVEYVQRRVVALRHEAKLAKQQNGDTAMASADGQAAVASTTPSSPNYENVWAVHNNAQRFMPNFFRKGQLTKLFFCFADPHFKKKNHRKRIVSTALLAEYAYVMAPASLAYVITDVADLMT